MTVKSGALTLVYADDPTCAGRTYTAEQSFVDRGDETVHTALNLGRSHCRRKEHLMRTRVIALAVATGLLALPAVPAVAGSPSCVGQFAATNARQDGAAFGAEMSFGARFASQPNFGAGVVAPYAHEPRDAC